MPRNFDDVIMPEKKRSIRDIPIPESRRSARPEPAPTPRDYYTPPTRPAMPPPLENIPRPPGMGPTPEPQQASRFSRFSKKKKFFLTGGLLFLLLAAILLTIFNGATLAYTPKSSSITFDGDFFTADKSGEDNLIYSVVKLSKDRGAGVNASGPEVNVTRKASGTIVVYNDASTESQRLVENTRFETPDGLIYRIPQAIVIPGKKTVAGKSQPGSVETTVIADQGGTDYNIGLVDFTVPGLKGSPRYSTIYARSKTPMTGGFVGMEKAVSEAEKSQAKVQLESALREELLSEARAQAPEGFVLIPTLAQVTFEELPQTSSNDGVEINLRANLAGVMFKEADLSNHLARDKAALLETEIVELNNLDGLEFAFGGDSANTLLTSEEISFAVRGSSKVVWVTDETALKADLSGKKRDEVQRILNNYPAIVSATATIRPFWKRSFPSDVSKITLERLLVE